MSQLILGICWLFSPLTRLFDKVFSRSLSSDVASINASSDDGYNFIKAEENLEELRHDPYSYYDPADAELLGHPWK